MQELGEFFVYLMKPYPVLPQNHNYLEHEVNMIWHQFDTNRNGVLGQDEAFNLIVHILKQRGSPYPDYN